jgi:predicted lipid-binding transport protein (Tim44 family)
MANIAPMPVAGDELRNIARDLAQVDREIIESAAAELDGARNAFRSLISAIEREGYEVLRDVLGTTYTVRRRKEG